jgi:CheY-like chemotaxis protein
MEERILVVDDDRDTADTMARLIRTLGYEAKAVYDGVHAVEEISTYAPDLALIDISMPEHDGYETVQRIRQQPEGLHVIVVAVTGWAREQDKCRAYEAGFDLHVTKPMGAETLKELLQLIDPAASSSTHSLLAQASPLLAVGSA